MTRFSVIALALTLAASVIASQDAYMQFYNQAGASTLKDTSQTAGFITAVQIQNYSFGAETPINLGTAGAGTGKVQFDVFSFTRNVDGNSPGFLQSLAQGSLYSKVVLTIHNSPSNFNPATYTFSTVVFASQSVSGTAGSTGVTETITFQYGDLAVSYTKQNPDGTTGPTTSYCWNRINNVAC